MGKHGTRELLIGCVADDFTGGGDAASFLAAGGLKTLLLIWPCPWPNPPEDCDAVVIALKSRSLPAAQAVEECLAAVAWLKENYVQKIYFKYCSTFDSTPEGNIGPVSDAILEQYNLPYTVLCPSLLANGRAVRDMQLTVNGVPLAESPMRNHPLNPMWHSSIKVLMEAQSRYECFHIPEKFYEDPSALRNRINELCQLHDRFYLIPDYDKPVHGASIARCFSDLPFWTGGSELLIHFARQNREIAPAQAQPPAQTAAYGRVMLAGSCSVMTRTQIAAYLNAGGRGCEIMPEMVFEDAEENLGRFAQFYFDDPRRDILYYSSARIGSREGQADAIERFSAALIKKIAVQLPVDRIVVAGGETSGAVTQALGFRAFRIGASIAPGVPVLHPVGSGSLRIVLKSGNFGTSEFFINTLKEPN